MDERLRFVARLLEGEKMAPLCAEFGISRKTGYKIFDRTRIAASRRSPIAAAGRYRQANQFLPPIEATIVRSSGSIPAGGRPRSGRSCGSTVPRSRTARPSAPSTRCSIDTGW